MAPGVDLTIAATPPLPLALRLPAGQSTVELVPSGQAAPAASTRNSVKLAVVPDESERTASVIGVAGSVRSGLSASIAGASQGLIRPSKMPAMTGAERRSLGTSDRWYDSVTGPVTTGKYSTSLPLKLASRAGAGGRAP